MEREEEEEEEKPLFQTFLVDFDAALINRKHHMTELQSSGVVEMFAALKTTLSPDLHLGPSHQNW